MSKVPVEILLKSISVKKNGRTHDRVGNDYLTVTLIHPNADESEKTGKKTFKLADNDSINFNNTSYDDSLLFKVNLQGKVPVVIVLTDVWKETVLEKIVKKIIEKSFNTVLSSIDNPLPEIVKSVLLSENTGGYVHVIGFASVVLDPSEIEKRRSIELPMELIVPLAVQIDAFVDNPEIIEPGPNGKLTLEVRSLS